MEEQERFIVPAVLKYQEAWNDPTPDTDSYRDDNSLPDGDASPDSYSRPNMHKPETWTHSYPMAHMVYISIYSSHYCLTTSETANLWYVRGPKSSGCAMTCLISALLKKARLNPMRESPSDPTLKADSNPSSGAVPPLTIFWLSRQPRSWPCDPNH
jgi:hypothetical protein